MAMLDAGGAVLSFSAFATALIVWYRVTTLFSRHRAMTRESGAGSDGRISFAGAGSSRRIDDASSAGDCPRNGQIRVVCAIHLAHSAGAEEAEDLVRGLAECQRQGTWKCVSPRSAVTGIRCVEQEQNRRSRAFTGRSPSRRCCVL